MGVDNLDRHLLLGAVDDELAADHLDEWIVRSMVAGRVMAERVGR